MDDNNIKLFENERIRTAWDEEKQKWYFSVIDVCEILAESTNPRKYWQKLKERLNAEGNETATSCRQLKMFASDGKMRH